MNPSFFHAARPGTKFVLRFPRWCWAVVCLLGVDSMSRRVAAEPEVDFRRDILPILSDNCFQCHGPDEQAREADLRLDTREGTFRVSDGVAIVRPGRSEESELIRRLLSNDPDERMPPPEATRRPNPEQVALLRRWIDAGAPWSGHWAYEAPRRPEPAKPAPDSWSRNIVDAFILARLEQEKLSPASEAPRETLIRRVTLDLTGLPPTLQEVEAFLSDSSPDAYERLVDRLLHSPRYGERWAWDWLDAARYADTNGFQGDPERTMWPWRDWVVKALNENMPFDQFTVEQLAGDLLPVATIEQKLASGFHRNNMHNGEGGRIAEETRVENVFDRVETTATIWLGATFTCCRCHDHKYDPFTLRDYYGLYDIFNQMSETGAGRGGQAPPVIDMSTPEELKRIEQARQRHEVAAKEVEQFERTKFPRPEGTPLAESEAAKLPGNLPAYIARTEPGQRGVDQLLEAIGHFEGGGKDPDYVLVLKKLLAARRARDGAQNNITKVMVMDQLEQPRDTFILSRGAYDKPTEERVLGAMPASLAWQDAAAATSPPSRQTRLDLARWLVAPQNPLTARVTVNRHWQAFFGTGLVKTVEDFGVQGARPTHPELLDWLAIEFVENGWNVKWLHRSIVTSAAYRQNSHATPALRTRDPENRLLARGPRYRLPSWMLRDLALASSGLLIGDLGGASVKPYQPPGIWEEATFGKKSYEQDHGAALYRRSLYVYWRRIVGPTMFFDSASRQTCTVNQVHTNSPLHALTTLNDIAYVEAARGLAERVMLAASTIDSRMETAFRVTTARRPTEVEQRILRDRWKVLHQHYSADPDAARRLLAVGESPRNSQLDFVEHAAWTGICQLLLNLDEAISKE